MRDGIVLQTEVGDQCDKLAVDRHKYYQLNWPTTVHLSCQASTFIELSWQHIVTVEVTLIHDKMSFEFRTKFQKEVALFP